MLDSLKNFLSDLTGGQKHPARFEENDYRLAAAALMIHASTIDGTMKGAERDRLHAVLKERFSLDDRATAELIDVMRLDKPRDLPKFGFSPEGHRIRRIRRLSGKIAALEEIWLDGSYVTAIAPEELSESLYLYYRTRLGLWIVRAEDKIDLDTVPDWAPPGFGQKPGAPIPHVLRTSQAQDGALAEVSRTWFDHSVARYVSRLR